MALRIGTWARLPRFGPTVSLAWRSRTKIAGSSALLVAQAGFALSLPWLFGHLTGGLLDGAGGIDRALLWVILGFVAMHIACKLAASLLLAQVSESIVAQVRLRLYRHLQRVPVSYVHERRRGEILSVLMDEVSRLSTFLSHTLPQVVPVVLTLAGGLVVMTRIQPVATLLIAAGFPLVVLALRLTRRKLRPVSDRLRQAEEDAVSMVDSGLSLLTVVKSFSREELESNRYATKLEEISRLTRIERSVHATLPVAVELLAAVGLVLVVWAVAAHGVRTPAAELVAFAMYAAMIARPAASLTDIANRIRHIGTTVGRIDALLQQPLEPYGAGAEMPRARGAIDIHGLSFAYGGRQPVLVDVDLRVNAGETVAIIGENGAGKSTLAHLLMRLVEPSAGTILFDGNNIHAMELSSIRRQVGIVAQRTQLANATVRENICWGSPDASDADVERAAARAQAHAFIQELPQGYDTRVGDDGIRLSGGQCQRIALARALLKDPAILILDEATSMFDPAAEEAFVRACRAWRRRTVVIITHRPATLQLADRVFRLESGTLTEVPCAQRVREPAAA
nr:ABC transporter ATP-binding protein [Ramlibacter albus]